MALLGFSRQGTAVAAGSSSPTASILSLDDSPLRAQRGELISFVPQSGEGPQPGHAHRRQVGAYVLVGSLSPTVNAKRKKKKKKKTQPPTKRSYCYGSGAGHCPALRSKWASVKQGLLPSWSRGTQVVPGRFTSTDLPLMSLIVRAYGVPLWKIVSASFSPSIDLSLGGPTNFRTASACTLRRGHDDGSGGSAVRFSRATGVGPNRVVWPVRCRTRLRPAGGAPCGARSSCRCPEPDSAPSWRWRSSSSWVSNCGESETGSRS